MKRLLSYGLAGLGLTLALSLGPAAAQAAPEGQVCTLPGVVQVGFQACPVPLFLGPQGQLMTPQGNTVSAPGFFLNAQGQIVTPQGVVISPAGFVTSPQGLAFNPHQLDDDSHGRLVSCVSRNAPRDGHGQIVRAVAREGIDAADDSAVIGSLVAGCLAEMGAINAATATGAPIVVVNSGDDDRGRGRDRGRGDDDRGGDDRGNSHGNRGRGR
jgi:hypothetical protein